MRQTNIEVHCKECGKPFKLFSDDGCNDSTICWNYCPHCGSRNDIWVRFLTPIESKNIPCGVGAYEAYEIKDKNKDVVI